MTQVAPAPDAGPTAERRDAWREALRPKWMVGHVIVLVVVITFVNLGLWQLRRLHERQDRNAEIAARLEEPAVPVATLLPPSAAADPSELAYRRVTAEGTYEPEREVLVRGRSADGAPGFWDVVPLRLADGRAVAVVRGWIPFEVGDTTVRPIRSIRPPTGVVTVTGILRQSEVRGTFGSSDPASGTLRQMARVDVPRLAKQIPGPLLPMWVQLREQDPAPGPLPRRVPLPELDDGPHLSYAFQWFAFAAIGCIAWPLIVRRGINDRSRARRRPSPSVDRNGTDNIDLSRVDEHASPGA